MAGWKAPGAAVALLIAGAASAQAVAYADAPPGGATSGASVDCGALKVGIVPSALKWDAVKKADVFTVAEITGIGPGCVGRIVRVRADLGAGAGADPAGVSQASFKVTAGQQEHQAALTQPVKVADLVAWTVTAG